MLSASLNKTFLSLIGPMDPSRRGHVPAYSIPTPQRTVNRSTDTICRRLETISNCLDGESSVDIQVVPKSRRTGVRGGGGEGGGRGRGS